MADENCLMGAGGYGSVAVKVESVEYGINIISSEAEARNRRAFYVVKHTPGMFDLGLVFKNYDEIYTFAKWMSGYFKKLQDPDLNLGVMRVIVPSRHFDRMGVPSGAVPLGDNLEDTARRMTLSFIGTKDPVALNSDLISKFAAPPNQSFEAPYFYPDGVQLGGEDVGIDWAMDQVKKFEDDFTKWFPPPVKSQPKTGPRGD